MPKLYAVVLRYDTQARQADGTSARKLVLDDALRQSYAHINAAMGGGSNTRQRVWGVFVAPEYMFANAVAHGDHEYGDVRHLGEGDKVEIEAWLKGLSTRYPRMLLFPGSIAWKKPLQRDLNSYIAYKQQAGSPLDRGDLIKRFRGKTQSRADKAKAALRQNATDFMGGDLDTEASGEKEHVRHRGVIRNLAPTGPRWVYQTDDPSGVIVPGFPGKWTADPGKAAIDKIYYSALSNREKLAELGGGGVTAIARNTCLVYLNGRRVAKYNKAQDYHEVLDNAGDTVYVPGKSVPVFDVDGVKYGVEICLDHLMASAAQRLPSMTQPQICVLMSACVEVETKLLANRRAMVVHACSQDVWSLVGRGGVDKADAALEMEQPDYRIYSFNV
jgi:hypothetical protein